REDDRRGVQGALQSLQRLRSNRVAGVLVTPPAGHDDCNTPPSPRKLSVDLLIDVDDGGMADHQEPRAARSRFATAGRSAPRLLCRASARPRWPWLDRARPRTGRA